MPCDGMLLRLPNGDDVCIYIRVPVPIWKWPPDPPEHPDWLREVTIIDQIAQLSSQLQTPVVRESLGQSLDVAKADLAAALPEGIQLGEQFAVVGGR